MKDFKVKISVINPDYDPNYTKEWGFLERDYENRKYTRETGYGIKDLKEYRYKDNISFKLPYKMGNEERSCTLKNVSVLELVFEDAVSNYFIISKLLIKSTREMHREKYKSGYFYFYLLPEIDYVHLSDGILIATNELPEELQDAL